MELPPIDHEESTLPGDLSSRGSGYCSETTNRLQGSSRIRTSLKSTGEPSDSRQRKPDAGSQPFPPETSSPFTQSLTSPLMQRT